MKAYTTGVLCILTILLRTVEVTAEAYEFFGRSGNAIEVNFSKLPSTPAGAMFSDLDLSGFNGHTVLTSSDLGLGDFATDGRLWLFPNPARDRPELGDVDPEARGYQGTLEGTVLLGGESIDFFVNVRPGYTGAGPGSVSQTGERINRRTNNPLFVAQQQHRLNYLGFVAQGGGQLVVDGDFGVRTDEAVSTFQAAFIAGLNTTQASVDGIVGPNTASWLNAVNAPTWEELIDPDPQVPGTFSVGGMIGDFDILPSRDPVTGVRTGLTPQIERFSTSWAQELWINGSARAKSLTGTTQLMNAMSTEDGYGSAAVHATHRVGMDIDMHTIDAAQVFGNGALSRAERRVVDVAVAYIDAGESGGPNSGSILRVISSNEDILDGIVSARPGTAVYLDSSSVHLSHLHLDVGSPTRIDGQADQPGDFDFDDSVNAFDYLVWQRGSSPEPLSASDLQKWQTNYGVGALGKLESILVPEPSTNAMLFALFLLSSRTPTLALNMR